MSEITIPRAKFAALMHRILEQCYPDLADRAIMLNRPAKYLFGVGVENKDISQSISGRMNQSDLATDVVNGVKLSNYCKEYDEGASEIAISKKHYFLQYLAYARISEAELDELTEDLKIRYAGQFPPFTIRHFIFGNTGETQPPILTMNHPFTANFHAFTRSNWFFYFYEYQAPKPRLIRLVMKFEQTGNTWSVQIVNTDEKYVTYKGEIKEMTERILRVELTGQKGRTMNFMAHLNSSGDSEIYMGKFMKNSGGLVSCSVILHRIPDSVQDPVEAVFEYGESPMDTSVPKPIQDFFEKKEYVYTKVTRLYSLEKLGTWLKKKQEYREEDIVQHIFLAAPVGAYKDQSEIVNQLKQEVGNVFHNMEQAESPAFKNLRKQIEGLLQEKLIGSTYPIDYKADNFKKDVFAFQDAIQEKFSIKTYFAPRNPDYHYRPAITTLQEEWKQLRRSMALLMVVPARPLFSSCWVILGWAMAWQMPIFLLCDGEDGLPYMVRSAEHHPNVVKINLTRLHHSLANAPEALANNVKWRKLVSKVIHS